MRTNEAVSPTLTTGQVLLSLITFALLYALLLVLFLFLLDRKIKHGPRPRGGTPRRSPRHVPRRVPEPEPGAPRESWRSKMSLADLWFVLFVAIIAGYLVLDGFDLGVGMLHPFAARRTANDGSSSTASGRSGTGTRWLVVGGGVLFAAFPVVYAALFSGFYWALMLVLIFLILRTVAIEFRSKRESSRWRGLWDAVFSVSSYALALLLGVAFGNVISGVPLDANGDVRIGSLLDVLHPFAVFLG